MLNLLANVPKPMALGQTMGRPLVSANETLSEIRVPSSTKEEDKLQAIRTEYKYLVSEAKVPFIVAGTKCYLSPDCYTTGHEDTGYQVNSLYLDSRRYRTYYETLNGDKNRFKVRIRFYDDLPDSPALLEVKRRRDEFMEKTRAKVTKDSVNRYLRTGVLPTEEDLIGHSEKNLAGLYYFTQLCQEIDAVPAAYTSYYRKGFEPELGNYVRITVDHDLRAGPPGTTLTVAERALWKPVHMDGVLIEMKSSGPPPYWMQKLAERENMWRESFQKYCRCAELINPRLLG